MKRRAFTLIELLAVIVLIGILAGLLAPGLSRARQQAQQGTCFSNLRQLGIAAQLYWDDHDGRTFRYRLNATNNGDLYWFGWLERGSEGERAFDRSQGALFPYLGKGPELCPSLDYALSTFKLKAKGAAYGYGYNIHLSTPSTERALKITALSNPAQLGVLADAAQINTFQAPASPEHPMLEEFYYISTNEPTTHFRHSGKAGVAFADGHLEADTPAPDTRDDRLPRQQVARIEGRLLTPY